MRAAVVTDEDAREVAKPTPGSHQVWVRVRVAGLNRADLQVASGRSHGDTIFAPGFNARALSRAP